MKHLGDPYFAYFEHQHLRFLHTSLTRDWYILQGGSDAVSLEKWDMCLKYVELDRKAKVDLMLLAQSGLPGRTLANKILWYLLSEWALEPDYEDLSHKVTREVAKARQTFDRPPAGGKDLVWWRWWRLEDPHHSDERFSPKSVPRGRWYLRMGPGQKPLAPPECWGGSSMQ